MSGGVDSSVAATLLKRRGFKITGITMCFDLPDSETGQPSCCGAEGIRDAKAVADVLGIAHYTLAFGDVLRKKVVGDFIKEYEQARTPNPCIRCNEFVKFDALLQRTRSLGVNFLATGHYARIGAGAVLKKAKDKAKDQSYFLYRIDKRKLKHILFPLGGLTKFEVRKLARRYRLPVSEKKESQEICFVGRHYTDFLKTYSADCFAAGAIVDKQGIVLGKHAGTGNFTIGQRHGLGIAAKVPLYVTAIDRQSNTVQVGPKQEVLRKACILEDTKFVNGIIREPFRCRVKIRYLHREAQATVIPIASRAEVIFDQPQFAITPGQSAVFYKRDVVLGGGIISNVLSKGE
jgi:tRNA-specific 2-thiouridylase